jgi:hypothetical protein
MTEQVLVEIRRYVGGYWRKYHREMEVDPCVENYRTAVMRVLFSEEFVADYIDAGARTA